MRAAISLALAGVAALAAPACAEDELDEDLQLWLVASTTLVFDVGPVELAPYLELQPRFDDDASDLEELQLRAALLVRTEPGVWLGQGFVWAPTFEPSYEPEYRSYQELGWRLPGEDVPARPSLRLRTEQRFLHAVDPVSHRLRLRPTLEVQLTELGDVPLGLLLWDEVFVNLNDVEDGPREGYQQNRAFVGLSLRPVEWLEVQAGYMNQHRNHWGEADEMGHTILVQLATTFE